MSEFGNNIQVDPTGPLATGQLCVTHSAHTYVLLTDT